jgi:hypothetical protein
MSQNAEVFRTRLGRLPHKARAVAAFHYTSAPHLLAVRAGDEAAMRTWYLRDQASGRIEQASLQTSLRHLDRVWREEGPFDGVLGEWVGVCLCLSLSLSVSVCVCLCLSLSGS